MPDWIANSTVAAAFISAVIGIIVAVIGATVSLRTARRTLEEQARLKMNDLESQANLQKSKLEEAARLKEKDLESLATRLLTDQEAQRQAQLTEILKKRLETYPALYEIICVYGRNWEIEGKERDLTWTTSFLKALVDNNAKNGVFFSNVVYEWYGTLRDFLENLRVELSARDATDHEMKELYDIIRGPWQDGIQKPGLGSYIKDELGSYITAIVSARHTYPETRT